MIVNISVIPGSLHCNVGKHRQVTEIFRNVLCELNKQKNTPNMEIIVELPNGDPLFRRIFPDPVHPNESPQKFCQRVQKEIKRIV